MVSSSTAGQVSAATSVEPDVMPKTRLEKQRYEARAAVASAPIPTRKHSQKPQKLNFSKTEQRCAPQRAPPTVQPSSAVLRVTLLDGTTHAMRITPTLSVPQVKVELSQAYGFPASTLKLFHCGGEAHDGRVADLLTDNGQANATLLRGKAEEAVLELFVVASEDEVPAIILPAARCGFTLRKRLRYKSSATPALYRVGVDMEEEKDTKKEKEEIKAGTEVTEGSGKNATTTRTTTEKIEKKKKNMVSIGIWRKDDHDEVVLDGNKGEMTYADQHWMRGTMTTTSAFPTFDLAALLGLSSTDGSVGGSVKRGGSDQGEDGEVSNNSINQRAEPSHRHSADVQDCERKEQGWKVLAQAEVMNEETLAELVGATAGAAGSGGSAAGAGGGDAEAGSKAEEVWPPPLVKGEGEMWVQFGQALTVPLPGRSEMHVYGLIFGRREDGEDALKSVLMGDESNEFRSGQQKAKSGDRLAFWRDQMFVYDVEFNG